MRVRKHKDGSREYVCGADFQKEVNKAQKELERKRLDVDLIDKIYKKAKKEYDSLYKRIGDLEGFIEIVGVQKGIVPEVKGKGK